MVVVVDPLPQVGREPVFVEPPTVQHETVHEVLKCRVDQQAQDQPLQGLPRAVQHAEPKGPRDRSGAEGPVQDDRRPGDIGDDQLAQRHRAKIVGARPRTTQQRRNRFAGRHLGLSPSTGLIGLECLICTSALARRSTPKRPCHPFCSRITSIRRRALSRQQNAAARARPFAAASRPIAASSAKLRMASAQACTS